MTTNTIRYLSLFAGVGGFDLGADAAGWQCVGQVEWDKHCQKVLRRHWPDTPKWGDVREFNGSNVTADVIVGGFPCQDVSVAGKRAGLETGTRSSLYTEILRIVKEMRNATRAAFPRWVILENVKGLLSIDNGQGFRAVLEDLADAGAHLLEWTMLDSQYIGVPQRRQRIFIAACFDPATADRCPDPLFPVRPRVRGDSSESNKTRARTSLPVATSVGTDGREVTQIPMSPAGDPTVAATLGGPGSEGGFRFDLDSCGAYVMLSEGQVFVKRSRAKSADDAESWDEGQTAPTLKVFDNTGNVRATILAVQPATVATSMTVRRLTPLECERLQAFPDDHTRWADDGSVIADSHRYRMCGNAITSSVARWVCEQINRAERQTDDDMG